MPDIEHLVIDADQMIYSCGFVTEDEPEHHAFKLINDKIEKSLEIAGCSKYSPYIKGKGNFRELITFDYKATRVGRKPKHYNAIVDHLLTHHGAKKVDKMEVDDRVSMMLWADWEAAGKDPDKCKMLLSSPDKDLNNTPGWHLNPSSWEVSLITEDEADLHMAYQMLCGDRVDNIQGLPFVSDEDKKKYGCRQSKVGEKTAKKLIEELDPESAFYRVGELYRNAGFSTDFMQIQFNLLWMARHLDPFERDVPMLGSSYPQYKKCLEGWYSKGAA